MTKILVVDDSKHQRGGVVKELKTLGYSKIFEAANGQMAIEMYKQHKPHVVYMDVTMPVLDGINATQKIVTDYPKANVILMNSLGKLADKEIKSAMLKSAIEKGAKDYIDKPVVSEDLQKTLKQYGKQNLLQQFLEKFVS